MADGTLAEIIADLRRSQQAFMDILRQVDDDLLYRRPDDEGWTLAENLAHIAEARQFFVDETRKVLASPGISMGRTVDHPGRLQNIVDHAHDSLDAIRRRLITSHENVLQLLGEMRPADLELAGEHVRYGRQTLAEFIRRFMVEHDRLHVQQAQARLAER